MKKILLLSLLFAAVTLSARNSYYRFTGTMTPAAGGTGVQVIMDVNIHDTLALGQYYYKKVGKSISLGGTFDTHSMLVLTEYDPQGNSTGIFSGKISGNVYSGTWTNSKSSWNFNLTETYDAGSARIVSGSFDSTLNVMPAANGESAVGANYHFGFILAEGLAAKTGDKVNAAIYKDYLKGTKVTSWDTSTIRGIARNDAKPFFKEFHELWDTAKANASPDQLQNMMYMFNWYASAEMSINFNEENLLSVSTIADGYSGGAHGMFGCVYQTISLKRGDTIPLRDLFKPGYEPKLRDAINKKVRKQYEVADGAKLSDAGFFVDTIPVINNYYLRRDGIGFFYNPYEVTPWAMGPVDVFIPFEDIKPLLQPKGPAGFAVRKK